MRRPCIRLLLASAAATALAFLPNGEARAQNAGTTNQAIPDVLLLLDTSGSMERMLDGSLPIENRNPLQDPNGAAQNNCQPGVKSNPNRWGNLVQALTGNLQPYYSCWEMNRAKNGPVYYEFGINGQAPYDTDYLLPYHRPLSGTGLTTCAWAPYELAGAAGGSGVGVNKRGVTGSDAKDFPPTSFTSITYSAISANPSAGFTPSAANACTFSQARDGQLDAARDYVRFSLMTFDTDTQNGIGVNVNNPPGGSVLAGANQPFSGLWSYVSQAPIPGNGNPAGCTTGPIPFDVGARHWAAPPWEGRHVPFADPQGTLYDVERTNDQIQQVILGTRPFGATPIDGLVADARDYYWKNIYGPNGTMAGYTDPYFKNNCRDGYIILLTDGAPNLNLRPSCGTGAGTGGGICPYPQQAWEMVKDLYDGNGGPKVTTYVIGFSVNGSGTFPGDGFPTGYDTAPNNKCRTWFDGAPPVGGGGTAQGMINACAAAKLAGKAPPGSTADACCQLNQIAFDGSGANAQASGAFFAESQAEIDVSLGIILAKISKSASSRTPPAYSPVVSVQNHGVAARYVTSFIPNARRPWSGEIDRTRSSCNTSPPGLDLPQAESSGDSYAQDLAAQTATRTRFFISVSPNPVNGSQRDAYRSLRPYATATTFDDGINGTFDYAGTEVADQNTNLISTTGWQTTMDIDDNTCPRSRVNDPSDPTGKTNKTVPNLSGPNCMKAIWGFTVAQPDPMNLVGTDGVTSFNFNVRCNGGGSGLSSGRCSISTNVTCNVGQVPTTCPIKGEVCVPDCAALGAVYHSTPAIAGPPTAFIRDDAYRLFAQGRANRRPMMFVATTDGILHAFKALETTGASEGGNSTTANWELWGFIPPAVLPNLASNFPTGQQILLDGSPVVKDVVWDRTTVTGADQWHSMLVAGMGSSASGYYALNVSDGDCGNTCSPGTWQAANNYADASIGGTNTGRRGPHFMWQLTDIPKNGGADNGIVVRQEKGTPTVPMVALFGKQAATPAITQVSVDPDGNGVRQIGVAILPGGIDGAPVAGPGCARGIFSGYSQSTFDRSDPAKPPRNQVRRWASSCAPNDPNARVAGRNVMIVRVDTGEILANFGRKQVTPEVPNLILNRTIDTPFDSPMIGTPAVFPSGAGENAQRVFIGDADGTIWSIDLTSTDPLLWKASLFQDLFSGGLAADSQPIAVPLVVTQDSGGAFVVNAATGDQENIVASAATNYVYSIRETPSFVTSIPAQAQVQWFKPLLAGERVTGPMVVFDRTLYFATFKPDPLNNVCGGTAVARLWGLDYLTPQTGSPPSSSGGAFRWCPSGSVNSAGQCMGAYTDAEPASVLNAIIPGVTLRPSLACTQFGSVADDPTGGITGVTPQTYELFYSYSQPRGANGLPTPQAERKSMAIQVPKVSAMVDAWSLVFD